MLHIYHGDGKGKTTAALGLVMRELGHAQKVLVVQFLKDGKSGEISFQTAATCDLLVFSYAKIVLLSDGAGNARNNGLISACLV